MAGPRMPGPGGPRILMLVYRSGWGRSRLQLKRALFARRRASGERRGRSSPQRRWLDRLPANRRPLSRGRRVEIDGAALLRSRGGRRLFRRRLCGRDRAITARHAAESVSRLRDHALKRPFAVGDRMRANPESVVLAGGLVFGRLGRCKTGEGQYQGSAERDRSEHTRPPWFAVTRPLSSS